MKCTCHELVLLDIDKKLGSSRMHSQMKEDQLTSQAKKIISLCLQKTNRTLRSKITNDTDTSICKHMWLRKRLSSRTTQNRLFSQFCHNSYPHLYNTLRHILYLVYFSSRSQTALQILSCFIVLVFNTFANSIYSLGIS